jgi:hypothetical protein
MASAFPVKRRNGPIYSMVRSALAAIAAGLVIAAPAWAQDSGIGAAEQFFAKYVALEQAYDPTLADLYADGALIKSTRRPPMGDPVDIIVPAPKYKTQVRELAPVAKIRGNRNAYSDVTYTQEGALVRINALRSSGSRKRASPFSLLVGPSRGGQWLIYEELSESQL